MTDENEITAMAEFVAQAIHRQAAGEEEVWEDLTEEEQGDFLLVAHAAMGAHDAWLATHGYAIAKMNRAQRRKLLVPEKPKLLRPN